MVENSKFQSILFIKITLILHIDKDRFTIFLNIKKLTLIEVHMDNFSYKNKRAQNSKLIVVKAYDILRSLKS